MELDPIPQSLPVHFFGSRPQPPTSWESKKGRQERQGGREVFLLTGREGERGETKRERERKPGRALSHSLHMYVYTHTHRTHTQIQIVFVTFVCVCTRVCVCGVPPLPVPHTHTRMHAHRANKKTHVTALGCLIRDIFLIQVTWLKSHSCDATHSLVTRLMYRSWQDSFIVRDTIFVCVTWLYIILVTWRIHQRYDWRIVRDTILDHVTWLTHHSCDMTYPSVTWLMHRSWHNSRCPSVWNPFLCTLYERIDNSMHKRLYTALFCWVTMSHYVTSFYMHALWMHRQLYEETSTLPSSIRCALLFYDVQLRDILLCVHSITRVSWLIDACETEYHVETMGWLSLVDSFKL